MFRQKMKSIFHSFNLSKKALNVANPHITSLFSNEKMRIQPLKKLLCHKEQKEFFYDLLMKFCFIALLLLLENLIN